MAVMSSLRFHPAYSPYGVKNYFSTADYYLDGPETAGFWYGKLCEAVGVEPGSPTAKAAFGKLCDNINPKTDKRLTLRTNEYRRVGDDLIFSLDKELSVFIMTCPDPVLRERLLAMVQGKVLAVVDVIEGDVETRVRKDGAEMSRPGDGMVFAVHRHTTARPVKGFVADPQVHWHVFGFNVCRDMEEGGRLKANDVAKIYKNSGYYNALFKSMVAYSLAEMGLPVVRRADGSIGIEGLETTRPTFSKRTNEIEDVAKELNITDAATKNGLGAKLRRKKDASLGPEELRAKWDEQLTPQERETLERLWKVADGGGDAARPAMTAGEAVEYAIAHCSEQLSVITERELMKTALLHGLASVTPEMIGREMQDPRHGLIAVEIDGQRQLTTEQLQAEEDEIIGYAARGLGSVAAVGVPEGLARQRPDGKTLNDGQWAAVTGLLGAENRYTVVTGPAGSGKTDMLKTYEEGMAMAGKHVGFFATTSDAVDVLHQSGFGEAKTVAHLLLDERLQNSLRNGHVVVDETSMLGHKDALKFFRLAEQLNLKVTFVGDPMQHGSVPRGALLRILKEYAGLREFRLKTILRQQHAGYRAAVESLAEGRTLEGFDAVDSLGWVREIEGDGERFKALAADYVQAARDNASCLVVSPTHAEAAAITGEIRSQLRAAGLLGPEDHAFTRLVAVNTSEAERGQASTYRAGDVIQFHQNAKGFKKGERLVVTDPAQVPLSEASKFSLYRQESIGLSVNDKLRFTGTVRTIDGKHTLKNGMVRTVAAIEAGRLRLDNGWVIDGDSAGHFRHGFVDTSFGSQGKTVRRVLLGMSAASARAMNQEQMYVSASRGKDWLRLYTDDKAAVRSAIGRSSQKLAAVDLRRAGPEPEATPLRPPGEMKRDMERRRRLAHYDGLRTLAERMTQHPRPLPPGGGQPTHAERVRQQQGEVVHER